jgi:hypothetical protein
VSTDQENGGVTVLCAWCGTLLHKGGESISHGICKNCAPALLEKIRERLKESGVREGQGNDATAKSERRADP